MSNYNPENYHNVVFNYTPHSVTLLRRDGNTAWVFESEGVARCKEYVTPLTSLRFDPYADGGMVEYLPRVAKSFGFVEGLPGWSPAAPWRMYIVSQIVADAAPERADLLVPADVVRDGKGQVLGCLSFAWRPAR